MYIQTEHDLFVTSWIVFKQQGNAMYLEFRTQDNVFCRIPATQVKLMSKNNPNA